MKPLPPTAPAKPNATSARARVDSWRNVPVTQPRPTHERMSQPPPKPEIGQQEQGGSQPRRRRERHPHAEQAAGQAGLLAGLAPETRLRAARAETSPKPTTSRATRARSSSKDSTG